MDSVHFRIHLLTSRAGGSLVDRVEREQYLSAFEMHVLTVPVYSLQENLFLRESFRENLFKNLFKNFYKRISANESLPLADVHHVHV